MGGIQPVPYPTDQLEPDPDPVVLEQPDPGSPKNVYGTDNSKASTASLPPSTQGLRQEIEKAGQWEKTNSAFINEWATQKKIKNDPLFPSNTYFQQDSIRERELMRHLFVMDDSAMIHASTIVEGVGDIYKNKNPLSP